MQWWGVVLNKINMKDVGNCCKIHLFANRNRVKNMV